MSESTWYSDGLRFECTQCGQCCTGPPGFVLFSEEEGRTIARRLGVEYEEFLARYAHETPDGHSLNEVFTEHGYDCVFLDRTSSPGAAVCSLYEDRPTQCRTFPFWPEHLRSPEAWNKAAQECEGIGRGPIVPLEEVRISARRQQDVHGTHG